MITVLCLNPSVDRTVEVQQFTYGGTNRAISVRLDAGGKGVNVALLTQRLGIPTQLLGLWGTQNRELFDACFRTANLNWQPVEQAGYTRTNTKLLDLSSAVTTEINEPGLPVTQELLEQLKLRVLHLARESRYLVLTGSLPPACPQTFYEEMILAVRGYAPDCHCALDASGIALRSALKAVPNLVKPNRDELSAAVGRPLPTLEDVYTAAQELVHIGIGTVLVTLGAEGALLCTAAKAWYAPALDIPVRSTVGAGDAMLAGTLAALLASKNVEDAFTQGIAISAASVMRAGTEPVEAAMWEPLLSQVHMTPLP